MNSPEAATRCPAEWHEAKKARESLIAAAGAARPPLARRAAQAVMAQAECEQKRFASWRIEVGSQAIMAAELRAVRRQYLTTSTLYEEAAGYGDRVTSVGAWARLADLHLGFARLLDELPVPVDVQAPAARADYRRQMRELMSTFEIEAALAATRALDAGRDGGGDRDRRLAAWLSGSCEKLAVLDPESVAGYPACAGVPREGPE
ncbi:MAG TPA: hypothetical protein VK698_08885 [Kofleriaceae bacterium]|nr:hypothetical protein [Kofleriaceae bacterium]